MEINVTENVQNLNEVNYVKELDARLIDGVFLDPDNEIVKILDESFQTNLDIMYRDGSPSDMTNPLIISKSGAGKTSIVTAWAKKYNINLVTQSMEAFQKITLGGIPVPREKAEADKDNPNYYYMASVDTWYDLSDPSAMQWSVLYLDELNAADPESASLIQKLVNDHKIYDAAQKSHDRVLPYFLMTIATVNPPATATDAEQYAVNQLPTALRQRFSLYTVAYDKEDALDNILKSIDYQINNAKNKNIENERRDIIIQKLENGKIFAKKLLMSDKFDWWPSDNTLDVKNKYGEVVDQFKMNSNKVEPRSITKIINTFDGTLDGFIRMWKANCPPSKASIVREILQDVRVDDPNLIAAQKKNVASNVAKSNAALAGYNVSGGVLNTPQMKIQNAFKQIKNN